MSRIAFITSRFPYPLEKGDKLRAYHHLKILAENHDVVLFALTDQEPAKDDLKALSCCSAIYTYRLSFWDRITGLITALSKGWPFQVGYFFSHAAKKKMHIDITQEKIDHIHVHMVRSHPYGISHGISSSLDYMDAMSASYEAVGKFMGGIKSLFYRWESKRLKKYERIIAEKYSTRWAISKRDVKAIDYDAIEVLANGIDLCYYQPNHFKKKKEYVLFLGNLGYVPNAQAIKHFIQVARRLPELTFKICGARAEGLKSMKMPENCTLVGWVDDSRVAYAEALCLYAPIHSGAGQQNKVLESMAMGTPVVTSSFVQEGIQAIDRKQLIVADDHDSAVQAIHNLTTDPMLYKQLAEQARTFVEDNFDWQKATQPLLDTIV